MVRIDIYEYLSSVKNNASEEMSFEKVRKGLGELYEQDILFEELEKTSLFENSSMYIKSDDFIRARLLISEIKDKQEISEKLNSLGHNVGLLRATVLTKDKEKTNKLISKIMKNGYSGISSMIGELNSLKNKIDKIESLHTNLLENNELSIDAKTLMEQDFRKKHGNLTEIYKKQKNLLLNLSNIFLKLTKESILKK